MKEAKANGAFGNKEPFLAIWISDSEDDIIFESVKQLNSESVSSEFHLAEEKA